MKLITWNVQWFCGLDGVVDVQRVVHDAQRFAGTGGFDVLCLQEVAVNYPRLAGDAGFDQVAALSRLLPGYQVFFGPAVDEFGRDPQHPGLRQQFGNVLATRLPVHQVRHFSLPYPAEPQGVWSMPRVCTSVTLDLPGIGPVRIMTTHLEYFSPVQRSAQAQALVDLHAQACSHVVHPPADNRSGGPFQNKVHTRSAIVCGDFNFPQGSADYQRLLQPGASAEVPALHDAWGLRHGVDTPHPPTFCVFDRRYADQPTTSDFVFVSADLAPRVRRVEVDSLTQVSDHQPILLELE